MVWSIWSVVPYLKRSSGMSVFPCSTTSPAMTASVRVTPEASPVTRRGSKLSGASSLLHAASVSSSAISVVSDNILVFIFCQC